MQIWLEKDKDIVLPEDWNDSYIFTLYRDAYSTIYTNLPDIWYHADQIEMANIYEDLFTIAIIVFAADKRVQRKSFSDAWTRELAVSIPVLEIDAWMNTKALWDKALSFLTGDNWDISFRPTSIKYSSHENKNHLHNNIVKHDSVCLFSGGLDSFCGAITLLEQGSSPCLIGHNEYPKLRKRQLQMCQSFQSIYSRQNINFQSFTANSRAPQLVTGEPLRGTENTCRGRSLLFLCAALSIAEIIGKNTPVYIPENGFIGLNVPLTSSRKGSCSTRTTHPYFLRMLTNILRVVGISHPIINFFAYNSKREIVSFVKDTEAFRSSYMHTISCSHPCVSRYNRSGSREYPINCGYCYPCLIRKASLLDVDSERNADVPFFQFLMENEYSDRASDLRAVINSIYRYKLCDDNDIKKKIRRTGRLSEDEVNKFLRVYKNSMDDLIALFCTDTRLKGYIGI